MFRPSYGRVIAMVLLALVFAVAQAQYLLIPAVNGTTFTGFITDTTISMIAASPITDQATLHALWAAWRLTAAEPAVDFTTKQVNVTTSPMSARPGFHYEIAIVDRPDTAVPILRQATGRTSPPFTERRFVTVTTNEQWLALWKEIMPPLTVDFATEEVLLYTRISYYPVTIRDVRETNQRLLAYVNEPHPLDDYEVVNVQPYSVVVIAKSKKPVYFTSDAYNDIDVPIGETYTIPYGSVSEKDHLVIKDVAAWKELYDKRMPAGTPLPNVNFGENMVLVVSAGASGWGAQVRINAVKEMNGRLAVEYDLTPQLPIPSSKPSYPWTGVVVPKSDLPVLFTHVTIVPIIATFGGQTSLQTTPTTVVIKDVAAWKELYDKRMPAGTALPEVNFGENMVLVVFLGTYGGGSFALITSVIERDEKIEVNYFITPAIPNILSLDAPDPQPWTAVVIPKSDLPVTFTNITQP
jgi:hypothetical protein